MPIITNIPQVKFDDGFFNVALVPAQNISGWTIEMKTTKRFGGSSGLIVKSCASGYNNVSGIQVVNGAQGKFKVAITSLDTSGLEYGNYATEINRLDSGSHVALTQGYLSLIP